MRDPRVGIDKSIEEAFKEGKFDELEGKGRPLVLDMSPDAVVNNLLKNANVKPEWITLATEIDRGLQEAEGFLTADEGGASPSLAALVDRGANDTSSVPTGALPETAPAGPFGRITRLLRRGARAGVSAPRSVDESVAAFNRRWDRTVAGYAERLHLLNRKFRRFNLIVPLVDRQRRLISVENRLDEFAARFPRLLVTPGGVVKPVRGVVPPELCQPPQDAEEAAHKRDLAQTAALQQMRQFGRRPPPIG